jgi:cell division protein FtsL
MNAAARALAQSSLSVFNTRFLVLSTQTIGIILLTIAVLASALTVVYVKDLDRQLFSQLQTLQQTRESLHTEWGQLLLEQNTWAAPARVQSIAEQQLGMVMPTTKDVVLVSTVNSVNTTE